MSNVSAMQKKKNAEQFVMPGHEESNTVSNIATE